MAAMTMSWDQNACRYAAAVQTNGHRVEMISDANLKDMFLRLFEKWVAKVGNGPPAHIYYFRDGVSEGQYAQVLEHEIGGMKKLLIEKYGPNAAQVSQYLPCLIQSAKTVCSSSGLLLFAPSVIIFVSSLRRAMAMLLIRTTTPFLALLLSAMLLIPLSTTFTSAPTPLSRVLLVPFTITSS
jgi:hypothetical protein